MLPEIILREEEDSSYPLLILAGLVSVLTAFAVTQHFFPQNVSFLVVVAAAIPLIYPLMTFFLEVEKENHLDKGIAAYLSIFVGQVVAFAVLAYYFQDSFTYQISEFQSVLGSMGITGYATNPVSFTNIFANNISIFFMITAVSLLIGSAGAFILTWNASVMGAFFGILVKETGLHMPFAYVPHATIEMTGFIIAGLVGTTASASVYREHLGLKHWLGLLKLYLVGVFAIFAGAFIETV